ncbi:hypothetical protein MMC11_006178 [Xylographa trunciseda]|nr:hypothetical protein [Xylographa trunciseda]
MLTDFSISFSNGQPPTPTRTPTSATFGQNIFHTPKAESSFYDPRVTWNTADPYATSPNLLKTPRPYVPTTPIIRKSSTTSGQNTLGLGRDIETETVSHAHHPPATPSQPLSLVKATGQPSSSIDLRSAKRCRMDGEETFTSSASGAALDTDSSFRSAGSMQTPPPTSTSATRRKAQQAQVAKLVQQSAAAGRRMSVPLFPQAGNVESSVARTEASPEQFHSIDFSPDIFDFSMSGPATAPIFPQNKLFWEPKDNDDMTIDFPADLANPFGTPRQPPLDPFISVHSHSLNSGPQTSIPFLDFREFGTKTSLKDTASSCFTQASFVSTAEPVGDRNMYQGTSMNSVDPSLLFSSSSKGLEPSDTCMVSTRVLDADALQPYAYQIQEARRDKAFCGITKPKKKRKPDCDSPAVKAALETLRGDNSERPKLGRNATDSVTIRTNTDTRPACGQSSEVRLDETLNQRRSSSVKQIRSQRIHRKAFYSQQRIALALTIDSSGRARTETRPFVDGIDPANVQGDLTNLDKESDDSDSDGSSNQSTIGMITSQAPSFDFSSQNTRNTKASRLAQNSVSHSSKSSYTSTYTSSSLAENWHSTNNAKSSFSTSSRVGEPGIKLVQNQLAPSTSYDPVILTTPEEEASEAETQFEPTEATGSAQHELRKVLKGRQEARKSMSERRGWSKQESISRPTEDQYITHQKGTTSNLSGTSPTTISDPDLPSPRSSSSISENVRCICHNTLKDGPMISWYALNSPQMLDELISE